MFGRKVIKVSTPTARFLKSIQRGNQLDEHALANEINYSKRWIETHYSNSADRDRLVAERAYLAELRLIWDALNKGQKITYTN